MRFPGKIYSLREPEVQINGAQILIPDVPPPRQLPRVEEEKKVFLQEGWNRTDNRTLEI